MKLGIMSDLHMEFSPFSFRKEDGVFYIVAGDIDTDRNYRESWLHRNNIGFFVLGNHDYYDNHTNNVLPFEHTINDTKEIVVDGIKIAGATLWTKIETPLEWLIFANNIADFKQIRDFSEEVYREAHENHLNFLLNSEADVWVTHHCVSYLSVADQYRDNPLNFAFTTELGNKILDCKKPPKLIIHGHTHHEFDYMIGDTRVICHPRGYSNERRGFKDYEPKIVTI